MLIWHNLLKTTKVYDVVCYAFYEGILNVVFLPCHAELEYCCCMCTSPRKQEDVYCHHQADRGSLPRLCDDINCHKLIELQNVCGKKHVLSLLSNTKAQSSGQHSHWCCQWTMLIRHHVMLKWCWGNNFIALSVHLLVNYLRFMWSPIERCLGSMPRCCSTIISWLGLMTVLIKTY